LEAVRELLIEFGWHGVTIDGIAKRTGVARTTIYRHWDSVGDLVHDAYAELAETMPLIETGTVHGDLEAILNKLAGGLRDSCWGRMLPTVIDGSFRDETLQRQQRVFVEERRAAMGQVISRWIERGALAAETDIDALIDRLSGPIFYRHLVSRRPTSAAYIEALVASVLTAAVSLTA
jgi:AcrR family transcriptional regulator